MEQTGTFEKISRRRIRQAIRERYQKDLADALKLSPHRDTAVPAQGGGIPGVAPIPGCTALGADMDDASQSLLQVCSMPIYDVRCDYADNAARPKPAQIGSIALPLTYAGPAITVFRIRGGSMAPTLRDGAYVGIATGNTQIIEGNLYAVFSPCEGILVRRLCRLPQKADYLLRAEAAGYPEIPLSPQLLERRLYGRVDWVLQFRNDDALQCC